LSFLSNFPSFTAFGFLLPLLEQWLFTLDNHPKKMAVDAAYRWNLQSCFIPDAK